MDIAGNSNPRKESERLRFTYIKLSFIPNGFLFRTLFRYKAKLSFVQKFVLQTSKSRDESACFQHRFPNDDDFVIFGVKKLEICTTKRVRIKYPSSKNPIFNRKIAGVDWEIVQTFLHLRKPLGLGFKTHYF